MSTDLRNRTALVTGATSGIGRATALALGAQQAHVLVAGRDAERGALTVKAITAAGGTAEFLAADLGSAEGAHALAGAALEGARTADILINNAGIFPMAPTAETPDTDLHAVYMTNVIAPFILVRELAPLMAQRGHGAIINTISGAVSNPGGPGGLYGSSKASLDYLTRAWAAEFGPSGVRVNAVSPGPTSTEGTAFMREGMEQMAAGIPARRIGTADELAAAYVFLASDQASFIYGATLPVDGGMALA